MLSILLKYGPWRDALLAAWECRCAGVKRRKDSQRQRAVRLLQVLRATCTGMHGKLSEVLPWIESLGYNISHVGGPLPTLSRWKVLRPVAVGHRQALELGKCVSKAATGVKRLAQGVAETRTAVRHLIQLVKLADRIGKVPGPLSCHDWMREHESIVGAFRDVPVQGLLPRTVCLMAGGLGFGALGQRDFRSAGE